ncbi:KAP family P-loop NTPase fold protein [Anaerospora hongkongensis]|uniref:KAP family P-loop NTPase fold protein n=1 Tax=Anaerospora hongkongensis TaxID=244830 RepID=UPI00289BC672|nr:P-loop NTPase fold protein [Anaerospora hongkongensis]
MKRKQCLFEVSYVLLFKTFLLGILIAEVFNLSKVIGDVFVEKLVINQKGNFLWIIGAFYLLMLLVCLLSENFLGKTRVLIQSKRYDLIFVLLSGITFTYFLDSLSIYYFRNWIEAGSWSQLTALVLLPLVFFIALTIRRLQVKFSPKNDNESFFMSDKEGQTENDDKFGFSEQAKRFAEKVFNQGSSESLVFGIDAPWGAGKSTFVNLCKECWEKNYNNKIIVFSFDALRYENKEVLLRKFIEGLIDVIRSQVFAPEIEFLVSKYAKHLKDSKASFSFFGFSLSLPLINETMDETFESLEFALSSIDKKIVIIIDDLDRLDLSAISDVLFVVKKSFTLPNISYVLCYDTENIASFDSKNIDKEKINEFLEKFINVKTSIFLDNHVLLNYFTLSKEESLSKNLMSNPELVSKAVEGLKDIFASTEFYSYLPFVGDARKLKRLINTILLLEVEKTDFDNYDFDKRDLIHLLLIYINYPNIFRKIYNTETQGKRGFFSLVSRFDEGYPNNHSEKDDQTYKNSIYYTQFLDKLTENQKFIINKVFQRLDYNNISEEEAAMYACFNGSRWSSERRNLEAYMNLITKMSCSPKTQHYKFYINCKALILSNKSSIKEIVSKKEFLKSEINHENLWRVLVNSHSSEFTAEKAEEIIYFALDQLPYYSVFKIENVTVYLRHELPFYIVKLLDKVGWIDGVNRYRNNSDENLIQMAKWIFGHAKYKGRGILDILGRKERGVLGLNDLLLFRLMCCANRGGDIFNLSRALSKYENPQASTEGDTNSIVINEMRKMSQKIYYIFKTQFIDEERNIFNEIDNLTVESFSGMSFEELSLKIDFERLEIMYQEAKSTMKVFITYQLASTIISSGIGCGYYNAKGTKDKKGISFVVNKYLFNYCFNPQISPNNYRHFIDFLLINLSNVVGQGYGLDYLPKIKDFTKILNKEMLISYWKKNSDVIKSIKFEEENKKIYTSNYTVSYADSLLKIYKVLDEMIE